MGWGRLGRTGAAPTGRLASCSRETTWGLRKTRDPRAGGRAQAGSEGLREMLWAGLPLPETPMLKP